MPSRRRGRARPVTNNAHMDEYQMMAEEANDLMRGVHRLARRRARGGVRRRGRRDLVRRQDGRRRRRRRRRRSGGGGSGGGSGGGVVATRRVVTLNLPDTERGDGRRRHRQAPQKDAQAAQRRPQRQRVARARRQPEPIDSEPAQHAPGRRVPTGCPGPRPPPPSRTASSESWSPARSRSTPSSPKTSPGTTAIT